VVNCKRPNCDKPSEISHIKYKLDVFDHASSLIRGDKKKAN
jgi:hypothetical protein